MLFNRLDGDPGNIKNLICLLAKFRIYRQHCLKEPITIKAFTSDVNKTEKYERYYAVKNSRLHKHLKKWYPKINEQNSASSY